MPEPAFEEQALEVSLTEVRVKRFEMLIVYCISSQSLYLCSQGAVREGTEAAVLVLNSDVGDGVPTNLRGANLVDSSLGDSESLSERAKMRRASLKGRVAYLGLGAIAAQAQAIVAARTTIKGAHAILSRSGGEVSCEHYLTKCL